MFSKSQTNPFFKSKYADLPTILSEINEPLQKAELVISQFPVGENELETILIHTASGEWMSGRYKMTPSKNDPQGQGSVITYQRRYAIGAVLNLNIDEDDDGNQAIKKPVAKPKTDEAVGLVGHLINRLIWGNKKHFYQKNNDNHVS